MIKKLLSQAFRGKTLGTKQKNPPNWTKQEDFDTYFYVFFNCSCQSLIYGWETGQ